MSEQNPAARVLSPRIANATNQQLCDELGRRGIDVMLDGLPDDALRAECERRGFGPTVTQEAMHLMLVSERNRADEFKKDVEVLAGDRDEWKRRAEAAEADLKKAHSEHHRACASFDDLRAAEAKLAYRDTMEPCGFATAISTRATAKPDTAHYIDPLDLLCEDA